MHSNQGLYQGLLKSIGHRSLPEKLRDCISDGTFASADCEKFRTAEPFPHIVLDNFLAPGYCRQLLEEFPPFHPSHAVDENGAIGGKATHDDIRAIGPAYAKLDELIQTRAFLDLMTAITGIPDLLYDPDYLGGGTHENLDGQSLDFHVDFNYHHKYRWHRRINLILFLNEEWHDDWGGCLELRENPGEPGDVRLPPLFNRAVIFETNEISWHGFSKVTLPPDTELSRKTIALYFYTENRPGNEKAPPRSTVYVEEFLPGHIEEGHRLSADDMDLLRSLIDRRDSHIARLYQHERDLTARIFELEGELNEQRRHSFKDLLDKGMRRVRATRNRFPPPAAVAHRDKLPFVQFSRKSARPHLLEGWGEAESTMVWSLGPYSVLKLDLQPTESLNLHLECRPFTYDGAPPQSISVFLNGALQGTVELAPGKKTYELELRQDHQAEGANTLKFVYGQAISPRAAGVSEDDRELAVAWFNLWVSKSAHRPE